MVGHNRPDLPERIVSLVFCAGLITVDTCMEHVKVKG